MRTEKGWQPATLDTKLGEIRGMLRTTGRETLSRSNVFRTFSRTIQHETWRTATLQHAVSKLEVRNAIANLRSTKRYEATALLGIMWATAGRPSDVYRLKKRNVSRHSSGVSFLFVEGKGVRARGGPFTVHTVNGPFCPALCEMLKTTGEHIFRQAPRRQQRIYKEVRKALQEAAGTDEAELRSVRRGALQHIAKTADEATTRAFSNHASDKMLNRYLRWGLENGYRRQQQEKAAADLF